MPDKKEKRTVWSIDAVSVLVIAVVAVLLSMENKFDFGAWTKVLPHVIGSVNTITTLLLIAGFLFVKTGRIGLHRIAMSSALVLGAVFLLSYVTYHMTNPANKFSGTGILRASYLLILASHVLLSLIVLPLVLRAFFFAFSGQFERHRKIARFAFPIWLYVSISGVAVYMMVHHLF